MKAAPARLPDARPPDRLSDRERRALHKAERTIVGGLKAFVAVGLALKEIRDGRLYRERFRSFEEYCATRWDMSRPRGYELCAAAEVVRELSASADIRLLPENEAQVRPLTRLKVAKQRVRAWKLAVKTAGAQGRAVTARDTEQAVNEIAGYAEAQPVAAGSPFTSTGLRVAYADPPYVGTAKRRYGCEEVDHRQLLDHLATFDGWALTASSSSLHQILPLCPADVRVGAWVKTFTVFKPGVNPAYSWDAVIFKPVRRRRARWRPTVHDWISANVTRKTGPQGAKPEAFCHWLFEILNLEPGDEFFDLFEGTGAVVRAYRQWVESYRS